MCSALTGIWSIALRNLQVQRDAVRDARAQVEHNKRLVDEGLLAPVDIVAAEAQVAQFEQNVYHRAGRREPRREHV